MLQESKTPKTTSTTTTIATTTTAATTTTEAVQTATTTTSTTTATTIATTTTTTGGISGVATQGASVRTHTRRITGNGCSRRSDRTYMGPTSDLIVNDFDDERTLDEEEAMEGSEDSHNELSNLQKEGDMPLNELLAKYGYSNSAENSNSSDQLIIRDGDDNPTDIAEKIDNEVEDYEDEDEDEFDDDDSQPSLRQFYSEMVKEKEAEISGKSLTINENDKNNSDLIDKTSINDIDNINNGSNQDIAADDDMNYEDEDEDDDSEDSESIGVPGTAGVPNVAEISSVGGVGVTNVIGIENVGDNNTNTNNNSNNNNNNNGSNSGGGGGGGGGSSRLLRSVSRPQSEEEDDDCDYSPDDEEWKKTIMVGSDYQASIPEGLCRYDDALPYENEDKILWNPSFMSENETEEFLDRAQLPGNKSTSLPGGNHVRDDEQALYLLLQCGYNLEEALRRRRMNVLPPTDAISLWSEEECHNFESGLRVYGKDFHLIQKNKVRTRSVGELVQFYYLWKKTERHDIFTYKARMEKKKYALHPGITDYMDRFLEEQEGVRDRSSSPNVNYLLHGDAKRQRTNITNNHEGKSSVESWDTTTGDPVSDIGTGELSQNMVTTNSPTSILPPPPPPPPPAIPSTQSSQSLSSQPTIPNNEPPSNSPLFLNSTGQNTNLINHSHDNSIKESSTTIDDSVSHLPP